MPKKNGPTKAQMAMSAVMYANAASTLEALSKGDLDHDTLNEVLDRSGYFRGVAAGLQMASGDVAMESPNGVVATFLSGVQSKSTIKV